MLCLSGKEYLLSASGVERLVLIGLCYFCCYYFSFFCLLFSIVIIDRDFAVLVFSSFIYYFPLLLKIEL